MDRRTILALALVAAVIVLVPRLFPGRPRIPRPPASDTARVALPTRLVESESASQHQRQTARAEEPITSRISNARSDTTAAQSRARADTIAVEGSMAKYNFSTIGGALERVELRGFKALPAGDGAVALRAPRGPLLRFRGVVGRDTIPFDQMSFVLQSSAAAAPTRTVVFKGGIGADSLALRYQLVPDSFLVHVAATVSGRLVQDGGFLLLDLPPSLRSYEADTVDDQRHLAFAFMPANDDAKGIGFGSLDPG